MNSYKGKVVVITGGGAGIGFSFAKQFAKEGAKVFIAERHLDRVTKAVASLQESGFEASGLQCDMRNLDEVENLADFAWNQYGHVDVILNNAGRNGKPVSVIDATRVDIDRIMDVNFYGLWHGVTVFGKRFIEQGTPAAIYNIGSENSFFNAVPHSSIYVTSKHAVFALTEALREEVPDFIDVSLICPGLVDSEMTAGFNGMDTDKFTAIALEQLKAGNFYVVSHAYNMKRITDRYERVKQAYEEYAPRYDGDIEFDVRTRLKT